MLEIISQMKDTKCILHAEQDQINAQLGECND